MPAGSRRFEKNKTIGRWTLVERMDRDLAAPLWVAADDKHVAYVRHFRVRNPRMGDRLLKVSRWAEGYDHNGILPMRELIEVEGGVAVVSRYEEGQLLSSVLRKARRARRKVTLAIAASIAIDMLDAVHATGGRLAPAWAHGGLRPECVLLTRGGRARAMEIGVAGALAAVEPLSKAPLWAAYAAPEEIRHGKPVANSDVYSVAVMLWEMLVGRRAFDGLGFADVKRQVVAGQLQRVDAKASLSAAVGDVVAKALAADAAARYEGASDFAAELQQASGGIAERSDVSSYLEQLHVAPLDSRRRTLTRATGRPAPTSVPPAPRASRPGARVAAAPRVPKIEPPASIPEPVSSKRGVAPDLPPESVASKRLVSLEADDLDWDVEPSAPEPSAPEPSAPEPSAPEPSAPDEEDDAEPIPLSKPSSQVGELIAGEDGDAEDADDQEEVADPDAEDADDAEEVEDADAERAVPADELSVDIPFDAESVDQIPGEDAAADSSPSAPAVQAAAVTASVASKEAPPTADVLPHRAVPISSIPPPPQKARWPWFVAGLVLGCGLTYAVLQGGMVPTAAVVPPPATTPSEPAVAATPSTTVSASAAATASVAASATVKVKPKVKPKAPVPRARPRPKGEVYDEVWVMPGQP